MTDLTEEHIKTEKMFAFMYVCVCMHTCNKCVRARHY